jgi:hypothetical protein
MDKNELKDLVKSYFNLTEKNIETQENTEEVKLQSAKLVDGTPITNDKDSDFEVGDTVHVTTEAGESVLAPSGEHALEDGIVLVIDGEGKITGLHKPGETGQGSLAEELPDSGPAKILNEEEKLSEVKEEVETEVELNDAIEDGDELPMSEHEEEDMEEHSIKEEIIEAIMEEIAPKIEEMQKKLADHEEKMKEHYSSAASESVTEKAFSKAGFGSKPSEELFQFNTTDLKKMQYENILSRASKNN